MFLGTYRDLNPGAMRFVWPMKQLALYREGDSVVPVEYVAQDGWYYFTDAHGEPKVCKQNPEARPYPLTELGALLPLQSN